MSCFRSMRCTACGHENEADRKFCGECGARLALICPSCSHVNQSSDRFCGECGTALGSPSEGAGGTTSTPAGAAPTTIAGREAERRLVSVLFADLVGFTSASVDRDPEDVRGFQSR